MGWADCQVRIRVHLRVWVRTVRVTVPYVRAYVTYVRTYVHYVRGVLDLNPDPDSPP